MLNRRRFAAACASSLAWTAAPTLAQFRIEIAGVGATQIPLALGPWRGEASAPGAAGAGGLPALSAIVRADLERSGAFRILAAPPNLDERSPLAQPELRALGADSLLAGSVSRLADGSLDLRYKLWDVVRGQERFARSATAMAADQRLAAHRVADEIYQALTGERGIFATRIAYVTKVGRQYSLLVTDADGEGGQVALASAEPIISPAWAPNGRELAYVSFESQKAVVWVQDVQSGARQAIANFKGSNSAPAWSPNGRELAVTLSRDGPAQLHIINRDGSAPRRLTASAAIDTEPVYTPDGRTIYFVSDRGGGPQIYRVPSGGGAVERVTFTGSYNISPSISPDGASLAYIARQGNIFRTTVMDLASGSVQTISDTQQDESPSFAPNGRLLVYASRAQGRDVLMTSTLDGRFKTRLLTSGVDMREPAWGPFAR